MSKPSTLTLKNILTPTFTKRRRHPSIGCHQYDLEVDEDQCQKFHAYAGEALREAYVDPEYLASVFEREGFPGVAKLLEERFPSMNDPFSVRTGDFGEVVGHIVLQDLFGLAIPVFKIRYKTNWEKASFGIDIIAFRLHNEDLQKDAVVFAEVKTSKTKDYGVKKVFEEVESLVVEGQSEVKQKMRNAVRFVSERLFEQHKHELEQRIYRFLDCYTNPHYVEAFFPFLVRDKRTWVEDALDGIVLDKLDPDRVVLCVFLTGDLGEAVRAAYEMAAKVGEEIG
jgi:hypothetical protein